jgi:myo-inositol-1(or 4)-monophosphatase
MINDPVLAVAVRAARRAGSVIVDAARDLKRLPAHSKEHADIVTAADNEAENAVVATVRAAFPEHAVLGEESGHIEGARDGAGFKWIVDAIDGADNFTHGYPCFAVSIALAHGKEITHAVVLDPVRDELFTAIRGKGAQLNDAPIRVSGCMALEQALLGSVIPGRRSPHQHDYLRLLGTVIGRGAGARPSGSAALDLAWVASGRLDGFWAMTLKPWDVAPGALLVREAGGRVGDFAGGADFLHATEVIAAAPGVFNAVRDAIAAARRR